jgi:type 1 glutamine amidotransferase
VKQPKNMQLPPSSRRLFLGRAAVAAGVFALPGLHALAAEDADAARRRVESALPDQAPARPRKARRLLIFELNVNYGGHASIPTASLAFTLMGRKTGAFETVVSRDSQVFRQESLATFDAVFFNNNVGNLFEDAGLRQNLVDFIYGGGGLMGVHGTTVAFTKWPGAVEDFQEFGLMIGARGANHRTNTERVVIKLDDPAHPVNAVFGGKSFEYSDEFFRPQAPYSRRRSRVLLSFDTEKTDMNQGTGFGQFTRPDNDYAIAWVGQYGRGRSFYCTIAHHPAVFEDSTMLKFYLAAAQFALGDLPGCTIPSALQTPALLAQDKLGWQVGLAPVDGASLFTTAEQSAGAGMLYAGAQWGQAIGGNVAGNFGPSLGQEERRQIRFKLDAAGVRMPVCFCSQPTTAALGDKELSWRELFGFARKMGVETMVGEAPAAMLPTLDKWCAEQEMQWALTGLSQRRGAAVRSPGQLLKACQGRSQRMGICGEVEVWQQMREDPVRSLRAVKERLLALRLPATTPEREELLKELPADRAKPVMICLAPGEGLAGALQKVQQAALTRAGAGK